MARLQSSQISALLPGPGRIRRDWPGLAVEYAWLPPFEGYSVTRPNRVEVVFSAHSGVALELSSRIRDVEVQPGAMYVVGQDPTTLLRVSEYSDTLEMYPNPSLLRATAEWEGLGGFELEPTLGGERSATFVRDPVVLAVAHILRRACVGNRGLPDIEASSLAHRLAHRLVVLQHNVEPLRGKRAGSLSGSALSRLGEYVEENLAGGVTLEALAGVAQLSPFHFARCFKASTGLAPHQFVIARRIERAKHLIMTTFMPVQDVAWSVGFENLSHFRRQFAAQTGLLPGELRDSTRRRGG